MFNGYLVNLSYVVNMIVAATISIFLALLFRGGPAILYRGDEFSYRDLFWLVTIQFSSSIGVYIVMSSFFETSLFAGMKQYQHAVTFLCALLPTEITFVLFLTILHRLFYKVIKKFDPEFNEKSISTSLQDFSSLKYSLPIEQEKKKPRKKKQNNIDEEIDEETEELNVK